MSISSYSDLETYEVGRAFLVAAAFERAPSGARVHATQRTTSLSLATRHGKVLSGVKQSSGQILQVDGHSHGA